jgi:ketosteroid isomerase-like protein
MAGQDVKQTAREILKQLGDADGDLGEMEDALPALTAFVAQFADPRFVCAMVPLPPTPAVTYPGVEGLARAWRDWGETFSSLRAVLSEVRESESHIVLLVDQIGITRHDAVEVRQPSAMVWEFSGGRLLRAEFHLDQTQALRVAGVA